MLQKCKHPDLYSPFVNLKLIFGLLFIVIDLHSNINTCLSTDMKYPVS